MTTRRQFLASSLAAAVALGLSGPTRGKSTNPLKILVMGGTGFLGPHFVEAARARGHAITLFNRGKTNPGRFADRSDVEQLHGDRKTDLAALEGRKWDAVLDTSAYLPADVTRSASLLAKAVDHYLIVSSISVYAKMDTPGMDESSPVAVLADPAVTEVTGETYGGLKALSEQAAQAAMPGRVTVVRPGLIVGPGDTSDRFTYWPARAARGGEILAPDSPSAPVQFIDVRDLADFLLRLLEQRTLGTFNADAQADSITLGRLLDTSLAVAAAKTPPAPAGKLTWVPTGFLMEHKVMPWSDLPVWIPAQDDSAGAGRISNAKALAAGLSYRPLEATVRDTLAYWESLPAERRAKPRAGLSAEREAEVLAAWHAKA
jgi:2'-hydroxyisoflavone reductase